MKRRLISLVLTLGVVMSLLPTALAALPQIGFVSSGDVLTEEVMAEELSYSNDARTYTVALSDPEQTIRSLKANSRRGGEYVESIQVAEDGKTAQVTLKADMDFIRITVYLDCEFGNGKYGGCSATFINENKYFGYRYCTGIKEPFAEDGAANLRYEPSLAMGSALYMTFALGSWYTNEPVEVKTVTVADPSVAVVTYLGKSNKGNAVYELQSVSFGSTELVVEIADGTTYTLPVEVMVPTAGFSRDTTLSKETYIQDRKFYYSEENYVFYYVVDKDVKRVFTSVTIKEPYADAVAAEISNRGKLITFTVDPTSGIDDKMVDAEVTFYNAGNTANLITSNYRIRLYDGTSSRWNNPFSDVADGAWYYDAVEFVSKEGLMNGVSGSSFAPNSTMTRAMLWTILARLEGVDTTSGSTWYEAGRLWAMGVGISDGEAAMGNITREQLITMLWRYAQYKGYDVSVGEDTNILSYHDAFSISEWAFASLQWGCGAGLLQGDGENLNPGGNATRAQVAAILQRFCAQI